MFWDVIIVGAGPAGLSAALILGRCRRTVLICDAGNPRNVRSHAMHGFLSRDGFPPMEIRRIGREQLSCYDTVEYRDVSVADADRVNDRFEVLLATGERHSSRRLLLATGVTDNIPDIPGLDQFYGTSVFHCPYCDGWEMRDQPIALWGNGNKGFGISVELLGWSKDLVLCTDGPAELSTEQRDKLREHGIPIVEQKIKLLEGRNGMLEHIIFADGKRMHRKALFFSNGQRQRSNLPEKFGCIMSEKGDVLTGKYEKTNVPGLYVAGDASKFVQFAIVAAAEGAQAAFDINTGLLREDLGLSPI